MKQTTNYELKKPDYTDAADIADINSNMDTLDTQLKALSTQVNSVKEDISNIEDDLSGKSNTSHKHNAVEISANTDLNSLSEEGFYWCTSNTSNSVTNKPDDVTFFSLRVTKISGGVLSQELTTAGNRKFIRICWSGGWSDWDRFVVQTDSLKNPKALNISLNSKSQGAYDGSEVKFINITASNVGAASSNHKHSTGDITGLGTAATKGVATAVASGNTNLVTSGLVYNAINDLNTNNRTHIVVATYDTKNPLKVNADYTCTLTNATSVLKTAINAVAQGGKIELLDGTYNLQYEETAIEITKVVTIEGSGYTTTIHQPVDENAGEAKPIFIINNQDVKLKGMMLCDKNVTSPVAIIEQKKQGVVYDDVFFIFNAQETSGGGACIRGSGGCNYTRIQNCRVYKGFNNSNAIMFDFSNCTNFGGVIGANMSSGYNDISVKFANESHKNNTAVYGHKAIDLLIK